MSTQLFVTPSSGGPASSNLALSTVRGPGVRSPTTAIPTNSAAGISTQVTDVVGGITIPVSFWYRVNAFTLSSSISVNLWAYVNNTTTLYGQPAVSMSISRCNSAGTVLSTPVTVTSVSSVLTASAAAYNTTVTPTSTVFNQGDYIVVTFNFIATTRVYTTNTGYFNYNGATAGANGDAYLNFTDNIPVYVAPPPSAPTAVSAVSVAPTTVMTTGEIDISWTSSTNATSYTVNSSPDNITWTAVASSLSASPYADTSKNQGTSWYYRVDAVGPGGTTSSSVVGPVTVLAGPTVGRVGGVGSTFISGSTYPTYAQTPTVGNYMVLNVMYTTNTNSFSVATPTGFALAQTVNFYSATIGGYLFFYQFVRLLDGSSLDRPYFTAYAGTYSIGIFAEELAGLSPISIRVDTTAASSLAYNSTAITMSTASVYVQPAEWVYVAIMENLAGVPQSYSATPNLQTDTAPFTTFGNVWALGTWFYNSDINTTGNINPQVVANYSTAPNLVGAMGRIIFKLKNPKASYSGWGVRI